MGPRGVWTVTLPIGRRRKAHIWKSCALALDLGWGPTVALAFKGKFLIAISEKHDNMELAKDSQRLINLNGS